MDRVRQHILLIGFCASVLGVGIPYWMIAYREVSLPNTLYGPPLLIVGAAAALSCAFSAASLWKSVVIVAASIPVAVLLRVAAETTIDPTSHNLWPIEVVIALMLGLVCSGVGAIIGRLVRVLIPRTPAGG
jgi:hypothetical protein